MPVNDELGIRMKTFYEQIPQTKLLRRTPVAIRIDGKAFHTFTKDFQKPFDEILVNTMQDTMKYLCKNIQGCVLGYTQSDEITLILVDYKKLNSDAWFNYEVQKMCSIAASMATMAFNHYFRENSADVRRRLNNVFAISDADDKYLTALEKGLENAMFDARCFNVPKEEVTNLLYWRQVDAARNSVQMVARAYFSHSECQDKNQSQLQEMLFQKYGINWSDFPTHLKRGSCCVKKVSAATLEGEEIIRSYWEIDKEIPMFKGAGREYVEQLIQPEEE